MPTTKTDGKICYVELPAVDVARAADFYARVLGWAFGFEVTATRPSMIRSAQ